MRFRPIEHHDVDELMEAERAWKTSLDPDFHVRKLLPWAIDENDLMEFLRQANTRTFVIVDEQGLVHGGVCVGLEGELIDVLWFTIHPESNLEESFGLMVRALQHSIKKSSRRKKLVFFLHDREDADFRKLFIVLQNAGMRHKLVPGHYGDHDGWQLSWSLEEP